jgi:Transglutaminase-like superfamily
MITLRTVRSLSLLEWRYLVRAWILLPMIDRCLERNGYVATRTLLTQRALRSVRAIAAGEEQRFCRAIARSVGIAARRTLWPTSCLRQALAVEYFLSQRAVACEVKLGVDRDGPDGLSAHAWVEQNGVVLIGGDGAPKRFAVLG